VWFITGQSGSAKGNKKEDKNENEYERDMMPIPDHEVQDVLNFREKGDKRAEGQLPEHEAIKTTI
jgi:hypothetical protein